MSGKNRLGNRDRARDGATPRRHLARRGGRSRAGTIALAVNAVRLLCGSHLLTVDLAQGLDMGKRATSNLLDDLQAVGLPLRTSGEAQGVRYWFHRGEAAAWLTSPWMVGQDETSEPNDKRREAKS